MSGNKQIEENGSEGLDWRTEAGSALADHDPDKAKKRLRGRPKGSRNRKTEDFASWYEAQGFKDPLQLQAEFMSADPVGLQAFFAAHERTLKAIGKKTGLAVPSLVDIVKEQLACARDLAPYLHGKAPVRLEIDDERLPFLVVNAGTNQLDQAKAIAASRGLSVGQPIASAVKEINDLRLERTASPTAESPKEDKSQ